MDIFQPPYGSLNQVGGQTFWFACYKKLLRLFIGKCFYHAYIVICHVTVVNSLIQLFETRLENFLSNYKFLFYLGTVNGVGQNRKSYFEGKSSLVEIIESLRQCSIQTRLCDQVFDRLAERSLTALVVTLKLLRHNEHSRHWGRRSLWQGNAGRWAGATLYLQAVCWSRGLAEEQKVRVESFIYGFQ